MSSLSTLPKEPRICCVCCRDIGDANYYKIDGVRFWCVECGGQYLKEQHPQYQTLKARIAGALAAGEKNWERRAIAVRKARKQEVE